MNFIYKLLSDSSEISHKRFVSLYSLILLTIVVWAVLYGVVIPNELIYSLVVLIGGESALTMINKSKE